MLNFGTADLKKDFDKKAGLADNQVLSGKNTYEKAIDFLAEDMDSSGTGVFIGNNKQGSTKTTTGFSALFRYVIGTLEAPVILTRLYAENRKAAKNAYLDVRADANGTARVTYNGSAAYQTTSQKDFIIKSILDSAINTRIAIPQTAAGVGQIKLIQPRPKNGNATLIYDLPAGGTWLYWSSAWSTYGKNQGQHMESLLGIAAGGTAITRRGNYAEDLATDPTQGQCMRLLCWRIG